jgi:putative endonuclease
LYGLTYLYKFHITVIPAGIAGIQTTWMYHDANMNKQPCVYMLSSQRNGTLYIGVTSDLIKRVYQHRMGMVDGFTKRYGVHALVWYEVHEIMESAILREKQLKKWSRIAKIRLIEQQNPTWQDVGRIGFALVFAIHGCWIPAVHAGMTGSNLWQ